MMPLNLDGRMAHRLKQQFHLLEKGGNTEGCSNRTGFRRSCIKNNPNLLTSTRHTASATSLKHGKNATSTAFGLLPHKWHRSTFKIDCAQGAQPTRQDGGEVTMLKKMKQQVRKIQNMEQDGTWSMNSHTHTHTHAYRHAYVRTSFGWELGTRNTQW